MDQERRPTREEVLRACEVLLFAGHKVEAMAVRARVLGVGWTTSLAEGARLAGNTPCEGM